MAKGEVNAVVVGSDRAAQNGDIINKVGTYPLALMAKQYGVPFHVLVQDPRSLVQGSDVPIEERPAAELLSFHGRQLIARSAGSHGYLWFIVGAWVGACPWRTR
jgi:methylthioribose-1-phosphate isomerase